MGRRVAEQYVLTQLLTLRSDEQNLSPYCDIYGVTQPSYQWCLYRHAISIYGDATRTHLLVLSHTFRSTLRTVQELTHVDLSNQSFDVSLEYVDGLIGISVEVFINGGFASSQIAA